MSGGLPMKARADARSKERRRADARAVFRFACRLHFLLVLAAPALAQRSPSHGPPSPAATVQWFVDTPGPAWVSGRSRHFVVHLERPVRAGTVTRMLDSLEAAWTSAVDLLQANVADEPRVQVFVTASRTRFAPVVDAQARGLTTRLPDGTDVTILVRNDSVRAHTRHEVMHVVSFRAWGVPGASRAWLSEGLATFADGRCQGTTIVAVGRDLLASRPRFTAAELLAGFTPLWRSERGAAYVLAGTFVGYLWAARGRDGVHRLWRGVDTLTDAGILPGTAGNLTVGWRAYVQERAGGTPGLTPAAFERAACG